MKIVDLTLATPEENLACDEALLDECDGREGMEVLRFWQPRQYFVAVGYSNQVEREVNVAACRERGVPVLRRCSGGGAVLQGPGCLNYSLVLRMDSNAALETVTGTNRFVMERNRAALEHLLERRVHVEGFTDLAMDGRKFSGNAQRRKRRAILFHGSFLMNFDFSLASQLLPMPSKQPDYRQSRSHGEFLRNMEASAEDVKLALRRAWQADELLTDPPLATTQALVDQKYSAQEWNLRIVSK